MVPFKLIDLLSWGNGSIDMILDAVMDVCDGKIQANMGQWAEIQGKPLVTLFSRQIDIALC